MLLNLIHQALSLEIVVVLDYARQQIHVEDSEIGNETHEDCSDRKWPHSSFFLSFRNCPKSLKVVRIEQYQDLGRDSPMLTHKKGVANKDAHVGLHVLAKSRRDLRLQ